MITKGTLTLTSNTVKGLEKAAVKNAVKGPSRTQGQAFEWDVQLSERGKAQLGWANRDGKHLNVSLDGKITHK
ncbi:polymorphic toxin type 17 domain-containing protein [Brenneria populi]|uniref:polymorphic toxin type 17 domain-containing protein n=1 Tax=Brenneria populi TaxID=1505588 RepID=UPI0032EF5518